MFREVGPRYDQMNASPLGAHIQGYRNSVVFPEFDSLILGGFKYASQYSVHFSMC